MSKEKIVLQLVEIFRQHGYEGTSLSQISKVTGLGKASLYHHFPRGKEEMAEAALAHIDTWLQTCILHPLAQPEAPECKLQTMCDQVTQFFDQGHKSCLWAVLALDQAGNDRFHTQIQQALSQWIAAIALVLQEAGFTGKTAQYRAEEAILRIQGALVLARGLNTIEPFQRVMQTLPTVLLDRA